MSEKMKQEEPTHDSQEEEFFALAVSEGEKFDNRLFWVSGGAIALSLGYFQTTGTLTISAPLIAGYTFLILSLIIMLVGLQFSASTNSRWSVYFRNKNNGDETDEEEKSILERRGKKTIPCINRVALICSFLGIVCIVVYMFIGI